MQCAFCAMYDVCQTPHYRLSTVCGFFVFRSVQSVCLGWNFVVYIAKMFALVLKK